MINGATFEFSGSFINRILFMLYYFTLIDNLSVLTKKSEKNFFNYKFFIYLVNIKNLVLR